MKRSAAIGLRVDPQIKRAAEVAALEDYRSVASLLEMLLVRHLTKSGYLNGKASVRMADDSAEFEHVTNQSRPSTAGDRRH